MGARDLSARERRQRLLTDFTNFGDPGYVIRDLDGDVRGFLAAYVADEYTAGHGSRGIREVRRAIRRHLIDKGPHTLSVGPYRYAYLKSLLQFLHRRGYR